MLIGRIHTHENARTSAFVAAGHAVSWLAQPRFSEAMQCTYMLGISVRLRRGHTPAAYCGQRGYERGKVVAHQAGLRADKNRLGLNSIGNIPVDGRHHSHRWGETTGVRSSELSQIGTSRSCAKRAAPQTCNI